MPTRRIIPKQSSIVSVPQADTLIADALHIIQTEMVQFASKHRSGKSLSLAEARVLQGYIKSLTDLSKESRERAKADDLSGMSNEEMVKAMTSLMSPQELAALLQKVTSDVAPGDKDAGE